jgi:hypothetical protein
VTLTVKLLPCVEKSREWRVESRGPATTKRNAVGVVVIAGTGGDCTTTIRQDSGASVALLTKVVSGRQSIVWLNKIAPLIEINHYYLSG